MRRRTVLRLAAAAAVLGAGLVAGTPAQALSGGTEVTDQAYGFVARVAVGAGETARACTGALVSPSWVITARSCLARPDAPVVVGAPTQRTTVTVGSVDLSAAGARTLSVTWVVPHPERDVLLMRLASPAVGVAPLALSGTAAATGDVLRVAGFGRTATTWVPEKLHAASVSVRQVAATTLDIAGQDETAVTTCKGDAGGPALRQTGGRLELVAIHQTSGQAGCLGASGTRPGATETRVDDLGDWIRQHTPATCNATGSTAPADQAGEAVHTVDVNGDCRNDIIGQGSDGSLRAWASTGNVANSALFTGPAAVVGSGWTMTAYPRIL